MKTSNFLLSFFSCILLTVRVFGQDGYSDFHTHLTFKHFYKNIQNPNDILTFVGTDQQFKDKYGLVNWQPFGVASNARDIGDESNFTNYFQTNYSELSKVNGSILCNAFYPWEKIRTLSGINRLIDHWFVSKLSLERLRTIASDNDNPFQEFMAEFKFAINQQETNNGYTIRFVKDSLELDADIKAHITSSILTIEGAQVLSGPYTANSERIKTNIVDSICSREMMDNVHTLKNLPRRLFFITPSHFSWNRVSGFAKTLDKFGFRRKMIATFSNFESFRKSTFLKWGEGIHGQVGCYLLDTTINCDSGGTINVKYLGKCAENLPIGEAVISEFLNPNTSIYHKPTYIDVKHMDILARMQYYQLKDKLEKLYKIKIPVIASHTAVSGENLEIAKATGLYPNFDKYQELDDPEAYYEDLKKYDCDWKYRNNGINPFTGNINKDAAGWFYPWSINLYDEEIGIIHNSDGIMGLMLDGRQLGQSMTKYTKDYKDSTRNQFKRIVQTGSFSYQDFDDYYEVIPLIRNMIYIAEHCGKKPAGNTSQ